MPLTQRLAPIDPAALTTDPFASSFRDLLFALPLSGIDDVLDVGAGGFVGETTTIHLLERFGGPVTAVEIDPDRAKAVQERFGDRLEVVVEDVRRLDFDRTFDLVVLDLDSGGIPMIFEDLLSGVVLDLVRPGGIVISLVLTDAEKAFQGPLALAAASQEKLVSFMERHFGSRVLTDESAKAFYATHPHYRALVLIDKARADPGNFIGWLALQRLAG